MIRKPLIVEFKKEMNGYIWRKLMEVECSSRSIKQWYKRATNLNKYWKESRREEKRLRDRKKEESLALRSNISENIREA